MRSDLSDDRLSTLIEQLAGPGDVLAKHCIAEAGRTSCRKQKSVPLPDAVRKLFPVS